MVGGLGGAAIGAAVAGNTAQGAVIGGAVGAVTGALIGHASERGQCRYRDRHGRVYVARCPRAIDQETSGASRTDQQNGGR